MSNKEISTLYESVIRKVIDESRDDFYDSGMDEATLQDLRALWIEKLQMTKVAEFSWAKPHEDENGGHGDQDIAAAVAAATDDASTTNNHNEEDEEDDHNFSNSNTKKESEASTSVSTFQDPESGLILPTNSQTDGSHDNSSLNKGDLVSFQINVPSTQAKQIFEYHAKISNKKKSLNNTGQQRNIKMSLAEQADGAAADSDDDDDDIVDEDEDNNEDEEKIENESDEINSDLDDTEDEDNLSLNGGEDGKLNDNYIFCLYDKVQRVKNKWKFSLKDGVASINGKDYGFNKATGESDW